MQTWHLSSCPSGAGRQLAGLQAGTRPRVLSTRKVHADELTKPPEPLEQGDAAVDQHTPAPGSVQQVHALHCGIAATPPLKVRSSHSVSMHFSSRVAFLVRVNLQVSDSTGDSTAHKVSSEACRERVTDKLGVTQCQDEAGLHALDHQPVHRDAPECHCMASASPQSTAAATANQMPKRKSRLSRVPRTCNP
jgi:hypothetical protein